MTLFSNTTPFIALSSVGLLELLPKIFAKVHVSTSVIEECAEGGRIWVPDLRGLNWIVQVEDEVEALRQQGIHYNPALITRIAQHLGEMPS